MTQFREPSSNHEILSLHDAYATIWEVGSIALSQATDRPEIAAIIGSELTNLFKRVDGIQAAASTLQGVELDDDPSTITVGQLLKPINDEIAYKYAQQKATYGERVNPFMISDDRLDALICIDLFMRAARSELRQPKKK